MTELKYLIFDPRNTFVFHMPGQSQQIAIKLLLGVEVLLSLTKLPGSRQLCGGCGWLVRRTGTSRSTDSPVRQGVFFPASTYSADSLTVSPEKCPCSYTLVGDAMHQPLFAVKILQSMSDFGGLWKH